MEREKAVHTIVTMCRVLGVSPSGYHAWRQRPPSRRSRSDSALTERIGKIHMHSRWTYGSPRIHAELREEGIRCSRKRVTRLMQKAGIEGCHRRRSFRTTQRAAEAEPVPDLVQRNFKAVAPNQLWVSDLTYVPTLAGFLYLAVILDTFQPARDRLGDGTQADHAARDRGPGHGDLEPPGGPRRDPSL